MAPDDKVSVIIPVYNSERFLQDSIESVLHQTYENIEIIAINDGSTDNSLNILKQYSDKISVISQKNQGLASALNVGVKAMTGKWFKWFSPDDLLHPDAIRLLVNEIKTQLEPTIVYSNWEIVDEHGNSIKTFHESNFNHLDSLDFFIRLLYEQQINVNTSLIPASLFNQGCQFHNLEYMALIDYDFFLRSALTYKVNFHLISKSLLSYRIHSDQLSKKEIISSLKCRKKLQDSILSLCNPSLNLRLNSKLIKFKNQQPMSKKFKKSILHLLTYHFPEKASEYIILWYLNKVRTSR